MLTKIWLFIKRDPLRRGVALAFALFLYLHLHFQLTAEHRLVRVRVPVALMLAPGLQEQPGNSPEIALTLKGKPGAEFQPGNVQVSVKVGPQHRQLDGSFLVQVTPRNITVSDRKFSLHNIDFPEDGNLRLNLLSRGERSVPVRAVFEGTVPPGMELSCETIPDKVVITGAENVISKLKYVHTNRIPLSDAPEFFEFNTALALPGHVSAAPASVLARVRLIRQFSRRSMHLPVSILKKENGSTAAAVLTPLRSGAELILRGPAAKLAALTPDQVRLFVDTVDIAASGRHRLPIRCHVNVPEIEMVSITPDEVEIQLTKTSK